MTYPRPMGPDFTFKTKKLEKPEYQIKSMWMWC